jgi:ligand-binding sensor domain-containing protein
MTDMGSIYLWFNENRDGIIRGHEGEQVLLKGNTVIGYYPDVEKALLGAAENGFTVGEFLVQRCITEEADTVMYYNQAVIFGR